MKQIKVIKLLLIAGIATMTLTDFASATALEYLNTEKPIIIQEEVQTKAVKGLEMIDNSKESKKVENKAEQVVEAQDVEDTDSYESDTDYVEEVSPEYPIEEEYPEYPTFPEYPVEETFPEYPIEDDFPNFPMEDDFPKLPSNPVYNEDPNWSDWDDFDGFNDFGGSSGSFDNDYNIGSGGLTNIFDDNFDFIDIDQEIKSENKLISPKQTFQYSLSVEGKYPVFIDTGLVYVDGTVPKAEDLKEILRQISIRANAKLISDNNRFIILANDKFAVIDGNTEDINTLISAFEKVGVTLKVQSSRVGQKFNLADYLETNEDLVIEADGKAIDLVVDVKLSDSRVFLPVKSIGEALGGIVTWNKETRIATIKKDEVVIDIGTNTDTVILNKEEYVLGKETMIDEEDERMLSLVNLIVTELGGEMKWNSTERILKITTIETDLEIDDYY